MGGRGSASNLQNRKADIIAFPVKNSTKKNGLLELSRNE